jgi:hypothetical protein
MARREAGTPPPIANRKLRNIFLNVPSSAWRAASAQENIRLAGSAKAGRYVLRPEYGGPRIVRKGALNITRGQLRQKQSFEKFGEWLPPAHLSKRRLEEFLGYKVSSTHYVAHGVERPFKYTTARERVLYKVREARKFQDDGAQVAAAVSSLSETVDNRGYSYSIGDGTKAQFARLMDKATGPLTGAPVASRELPGTGHPNVRRQGRIPDGAWHAMIDAAKSLPGGENNPLARLLRESDRFTKGDEAGTITLPGEVI